MARTRLFLIVLESLRFRSNCNQVKSCCANDCLTIRHLLSAIDYSARGRLASLHQRQRRLRPRQGAGTVPFKGVLQRCDHNREAMLVQSVDTALLADAETAYEIRQDLKKGLSLDA